MIDKLIRATIFAVVGLALIAWTGLEVLDGRRTYGWSEATGTVEESRGSEPKKPAIDYHDFAYSFVVAGERRVGHTLRVGHGGKDGTALARRYPKGSTVTVYYDPADPARSVIERGTDPFTPGLKAVMGLAMLALAAVIARGAFVARRREAAAERARAGES